MFILFQLKKNLLDKKNLALLIVLPMIIVSLCQFLEVSSADKTKIYSGAIIDRDHTPLSKKLIEDMKSYSELNIDLLPEEESALTGLSRNTYDVVYVIRSGFSENIMAGNRTNLLTSHFKVETPSVKWVNDQISLRVMRMWSYYDILHKIQKINPVYTEASYGETYRNRQEEHQILKLNIHYEKNSPFLPKSSSMGYRVFSYLWIYILLFLSMASVRKVIEERLSGISERLIFSGVSKRTYLLSSCLNLLITAVLPFMISLLWMEFLQISANKALPGRNFFFFPVYSLGAIFFTLICWSIFYLIARRSKTVQAYNLVTQLLFLLVIILSGLLM